MQTLHLDLKLIGENFAELRYFLDNPHDYQSRSLPLKEIAELTQLAEQDYYVRMAVEYAVTGKLLYDWLDGSDRFLTRFLNQHRGEGIVLAIAAAKQLAHLPWEVLHDGNSFLVARMPGVVPVRWVSSDAVQQLSMQAAPENRALNVLFMATSPLGVEPVLDFEAEEGLILEATARQPLALTVEESGCLSELGYLVAASEQDYDVLHITGHATLSDGEPRFITETETGDAYLASASDIAQELQFKMPKLIFLSGCRTGQAGNSGAVPSMAEELLTKGAKVVLGWGQKVLDSDAQEAAAALYQALSAGKQVTEAVVCTYQALIKNQARDWHLLRLYAAATLPGQLVTPLRTPGRKKAPQPSVAEQFLDVDTKKRKVPTRESFVGRRRQLQNCLRSLTQSPNEVGVLIHGMGGLGKSSLAARLCDRLADFERIVWVGRIDESSLVRRLAEKLDSKELRQALQANDEELKYKLRRVFRQLDAEDKSFLLVLDDFEDNLEPRNQGYVLQPQVVEVLEALVWAIRETYSSHRLILTCRYDFEYTQLQYFYKQPLEAMHGADLRKKCDRLAAFGSKSKVDQALQSQARRLADGNPRLLEWLNKVLLNLDPPQTPLKTEEKSSVVEILARLETDPVELREQVLAETLLSQMDQLMREMLQRVLVFELPVPKEAITAVCAGISDLEQQINRAVALGLLEVSPEFWLRVPRILPLQLPENTETLHQQGAEVLYRLWWQEAETSTEEQRLEMHRLALRGQLANIAVEIAATLANRWNNQSRFREAVQLCQSTLEISEDYWILHCLAAAEVELGEVSKAQTHYQQALDSCPAADEKEKAAIIHNLAGIYARTGEVEQAIAFYQQSLELQEQIGNVQGKAATLHQLAIIYANTGKVEQAIAFYQQSLELQEQIGNVQGKAATLHQLAIIYANTGKVEQAIAFYEQSLELQEQIGDVQGKAATLAMMGQLLAYAKGDVATGLAYLQESLKILQQIRSPDAETVKSMIAEVQQMPEKEMIN